MNLTQTSFTGSVEATKPDLESISQEEDYDISQEVENITGEYSCTFVLFGKLLIALMYC